MDKKKRTAIIISAVIVFVAVCMIALVFLRDDESVKAEETTTEMAISTEKPQATTEEKTEASTEETTEVTTETAASTEKPSEEEPTTEAPATEGTTSAPAKPENSGSVKPETTEAPTQPEPTTSTPTTEAPKPEPAPSAPTTEEPKHEHSWVWVETKAAGKVWIVDQAAWTETVETQVCVDTIPTIACNYCGECFTTADAYRAHRDAQTDDQHACAGHGTGTPIAIYETVVETIEHPEVGHWEETPAEGYYKCSCGATK